MNPLLLITTITLYLVSLVGSFVLTLLSKKFSNQKLNILVTIHFIITGFALSTSFIKGEGSTKNYLMSIAFCSGLIIAGWAIRKAGNKILKIYFATFFASIILFLYSPSLLFYSISGNFSQRRREQQFRLEKNYYLIEQQSMLQLLSNVTAYKVSQKFGIYNRTIARDIQFEGVVDSAQVILMSDDTLIIRGYLKGSSKDIHLKPGMNKSKITRKIN